MPHLLDCILCFVSLYHMPYMHVSSHGNDTLVYTQLSQTKITLQMPYVVLQVIIQDFLLYFLQYCMLKHWLTDMQMHLKNVIRRAFQFILVSSLAVTNLISGVQCSLMFPVLSWTPGIAHLHVLKTLMLHFTTFSSKLVIIAKYTLGHITGTQDFGVSRVASGKQKKF